MKTASVYAYARRHGHMVLNMRYKKAASIAVQLPGGQCCIGLDRTKLRTDAERKTALFHELGHCETGAFYTRYSPVDNRGKCEEMADRWAIRKELSYKKLLQAMRAGHTEAWDLADYSGVTEDMIRKAVDFYTDACGLKFE